jgi:hypothetical protein
MVVILIMPVDGLSLLPCLVIVSAQANMFGKSNYRDGGTRGGADRFKWDDVKEG